MQKNRDQHYYEYVNLISYYKALLMLITSMYMSCIHSFSIFSFLQKIKNLINYSILYLKLFTIFYERLS